MTEIILKDNQGYIEFLDDLKNKIRVARVKAVISVNSQLIILYWEIGRGILMQQRREGWGSKVIDLLSRDLSCGFEDMKGFSVRNLKYMRKFAELFPDIQIVQQAVAQIPWGHNVILMNKVSSKAEEYIWYVRQLMLNGWSRDVLVHQIESNLYKRQTKEKITNYENTLPKEQSRLANQTLKDPYLFNFLSVGKEAHEREIEKELTKHIQKFLIELGKGFAFIGNQYHIEVDNKDYFLDLFFYNFRLRSFFVIEIKSGEFKPENVGKLNFYLSAVDDLIKHGTDNPSIGIILCKDKGGKVRAEYALKNVTSPIGIAEYKIVDSIPDALKSDLPTVEELEKELSQKVK